MNILFVNPSTSRYTRSVSVPLGLLSIASYLESFGYNVKIYDRTVDKTSLEDILESFSPDLAGISIVSYKSITDAIKIAQQLKSLSIPVIAGGPLPSVLASQTLAHDCFDAVSVGEGELTWLELAEYYKNKVSQSHDMASLSEIKGLAVRGSDGSTLFTKTRPFADLATLAPLNWNLINVPKYFQSSYNCSKMLYLYSAKGCPFSCTFCYNKDFHKCTYRKRPLEFLLDEIRLLVTRYGMDGVYFADEMWCRNRDEMHDICDSLKNLNLDFVWGCQTRIGIFDEDDFRYMYDSGCRWIFFGIESGSKNMLDKLNKRINYDKICSTFTHCRNAQITTIGSFITAIPDETEQDLQETVNLIEQLDTKLININYLAVIPGSEIYKKLVGENKYHQTATLLEFSKQKPMERLEYNFSNIPDIDIKVIRAYYMWRSFTATDIPGTKKFSFAKKVITDALKSIKTGNLISFIVSTFMAGAEFTKTAFYAHAFPSVKKKYGLKK